MRCMACDFLPPNLGELLEGDLCFKCFCIVQEALYDDFPEMMSRSYACEDVVGDGLVIPKPIEY